MLPRVICSSSARISSYQPLLSLVWLPLLVFCITHTASADSVFRFRGSGLEVEAHSPKDNKNSLQISISGLKSTDVKIFDIPDPNRIVVDFMGPPPRLFRQVSSENAPLVSRMRIGSHTDKLRLVFDLKPGVVPPYTIDQKQDRFLLDLGERIKQREVLVREVPLPEVINVSTAKTTPILAVRRLARIAREPSEFEENSLSEGGTENRAVAPDLFSSDRASLRLPPPAVQSLEISENAMAVIAREAMSEATSASPQGIIEPSERARRIQPELAESALEKGALVKQEAKEPISELLDPHLREIRFESLPPKDTPVIRFELSEERKFKLIKTDPATYRLRIKDCVTAGEHLRLPYFPPQDFSGLSLVRVDELNGDSVVTIGVERGTRLTTFVRGNSIYIRAFTS